MQAARILLPFLSAIATALVGTETGAQTPSLVLAQAGYPPCQPPNPQEYLLLVVSSTPEVQAKVRNILPTTANPTVCLYLTNIVTRVGGFTTVDAATAWSKYMNENLGVQAFVAKPLTTAVSPTTPTPAPTTPNTSYSPQLLGTGYAVLVNYFNQPEIAAEVKQFLSQDVGLVAYDRRPFLLALYTPDATLANTTLQRLSDRGYSALVVDGRQLMLLRSVVQY